MVEEPEVTEHTTEETELAEDTEVSEVTMVELKLTKGTLEEGEVY